jgi:hypothetical protein
VGAALVALGVAVAAALAPAGAAQAAPAVVTPLQINHIFNNGRTSDFWAAYGDVEIWGLTVATLIVLPGPRLAAGGAGTAFVPTSITRRSRFHPFRRTHTVL